jgi:hypothetical protein
LKLHKVVSIFLFYANIFKKYSPIITGVNKCRIKVIPNYQRGLGIVCLNTYRILTWKLSIKRGKNRKNPSREREMLLGKRLLTRLPGVELKKCMKRILKGNG